MIDDDFVNGVVFSLFSAHGYLLMGLKSGIAQKSGPAIYFCESPAKAIIL
jgi:hypothetical protein